MTTGPDLAVLVSVPVLLATLARGAFDWLLLGQLAASAAAVGIGWAYAAPGRGRSRDAHRGRGGRRDGG